MPNELTKPSLEGDGQNGWRLVFRRNPDLSVRDSLDASELVNAVIRSAIQQDRERVVRILQAELQDLHAKMLDDLVRRVRGAG